MTLRRSPMPRPTKPLAAMSASRRAERAAAGDVSPFSTLTSGSTLARKPMLRTAAPVKRRASRPSADNPDKATVFRVLDRDGECCVRCGLGLSGVRGVDWSIHHRRLRSQGGDHCPANLVALCGHGSALCHGFVHAHPRRARLEGGWILRRADDPAAYPVMHARLGFVFLTAGGGSVSSLAGQPSDFTDAA